MTSLKNTPNPATEKDTATAMQSTDELLRVEDLKVHFKVQGEGLFSHHQTLKAVDGISFAIKKGETLGVVGESGCGKSTLGRALLQIYKPTEGKIFWEGKDITHISTRAVRAFTKEATMIFQDPLASLNPRMTIGEIVREPLVIHCPKMSRADREERVAQMLSHVGIHHRMINRYPHEFSGGQCQRIGIARAMIIKPKLVVCDEPVSALDVSIQAQVIALLQDLQEEFNLSLVFISHDLSVVRHISHRVLVLYLGKTMLLSEVGEHYTKMNHPYARALISAVPEPDIDKEKRTPTSHSW